MSPYFCGMAAIPVCPENPGLPRGGRVWWRVLHIMLYLRHPAAVVSYPPSFPIRRRFLSAAVPGFCRLPGAAVSCPPPFLVRRCLQASAVSCPPCRRAKTACPHLPALRASVRRLVPARVLDVVHHDPARARRAGRNARIGRDRPLAARIEILRMQPVAFGDGACELFVEFL